MGYKMQNLPGPAYSKQRRLQQLDEIMARRGIDKGDVYVCRKCVSIVGGVDAKNRYCPNCYTWEGETPLTNPLWQCNDGRIIPISEMEQSHLQFSINLILTKGNWRQHYMDPLLHELKRRKEQRERDDARGQAGDQPGGCAEAASALPDA